jgi:hypothetical protein
MTFDHVELPIRLRLGKRFVSDLSEGTDLNIHQNYLEWNSSGY